MLCIIITSDAIFRKVMMNPLLSRPTVSGKPLNTYTIYAFSSRKGRMESCEIYNIVLRNSCQKTQDKNAGAGAVIACMKEKLVI